jgi:glycosyltransferase involved in cell wall biosynthesis
MQSQGYGFSVPTGDAHALAQLLIRLADDDEWKEEMNAAALSAFERNFFHQVVLQRWSRLIEARSVV